jgi:hypothetical protein
MAKPSRDRIIEALLHRHKRTFAEELKIDLHKGTPSVLFQWLCASLLFSARISADLALRAARALNAQGWTTPRKMAGATWEERTKTLNQSGYARYDERTSRMLGDTAQLLLDEYGGDLRKLREAAEHDPAKERALLKRFKGIGDVGVDVFFREAQLVWDELFPFADRRALAAAKKLGLDDDAAKLAKRVAKRDFPRLVAALARVDVSGDHDAVLEHAAR